MIVSVRRALTKKLPAPILAGREQHIKHPTTEPRQRQPEHRAEDPARDCGHGSSLPGLMTYQRTNDTTDRHRDEDEEPAREVGEHGGECTRKPEPSRRKPSRIFQEMP